MRTAAKGAFLVVALAWASAAAIGCSKGPGEHDGADAAGTGGAGGGAGGSGGGAAGGPGDAGPVMVGAIAACPEETNPPSSLAAGCMQCVMPLENPTMDGCCNIKNDDVGVGLCQMASACMRAGECEKSGDVSSCFCGANDPTCQGGGSSGPCADYITAAAARNVTTLTTDAPTPAQVRARWHDPSYALAWAVNVHGIAGLFCSAQCGL